METIYLVLGMVIALMMTAPIMCVYNLEHGRKFLASLWFLYLFAAGVMLVWLAHEYHVYISRLVANTFADFVLEGIGHESRGTP